MFCFVTVCRRYIVILYYKWYSYTGFWKIHVWMSVSVCSILCHTFIHCCLVSLLLYILYHYTDGVNLEFCMCDCNSKCCMSLHTQIFKAQFSFKYIGTRSASLSLTVHHEVYLPWSNWRVISLHTIIIARHMYCTYAHNQQLVQKEANSCSLFPSSERCI